MIIELNKDLKKSEYPYRRSVENVLKKTIQPLPMANKYDDPVASKNEELIGHDIPGDAIAYHVSYVDYLQQAYAEHRSIVITPDIVWYTILCEIAAVVRANPKVYGSLFTTDPDEKTTIMVMTDDITSLPLTAIAQALISLVPSDAEAFLPGYSTSTVKDTMAKFAAFADVCSPYYNYMTYCCGFPSIKILGGLEDWNDMWKQDIPRLQKVFQNIDDGKLLEKYLGKVGLTVYALEYACRYRDPDFFNKILTTKRCGSGGEVECDGWWATSMYVKDYKRTKPENFPTHVSRVEYTNAETKRKFVLSYGLFYSTSDEGFDFPTWGSIVREFVDVKGVQKAEAGV